MSIVFTSVIIGAANPIYIFYRDGILYTLTGVLFPFVERNSILEIYINLVYQSITAAVAGLGFVIIQVSSSLFVNTINVTTELTIQEMVDLSDDLKCNNSSRAKKSMKLIRIFNQIQRIDE